MEEDLTPCWKRDEWTRDNNHTPNKIDGQAQEDFEAGIRAQLICTTRCPKRRECFDLAMAFGEDNDWFVWGGYTGWERARIRENGPLPVPPTARKFKRPNMDRINLLIDSNAPFEDLAEHWGIAPKTVPNIMRGYLWALRVENQDPSVILQDVPDSSDNITVDLPQKVDSVRAA